MPTYNDPYSGRPDYRLYLTVSLYATDPANNRSRYSYRLYIKHVGSGTNNSYATTARPWRVRFEGSTVASGTAPFLMGPSGDYVGKEITLKSGTTGWYTHNPTTGALTVNVDARHLMSPDVQGDASLSGSFAAPVLPRTPGKPTGVNVQNVQGTSAEVIFTEPSEVGGSAIVDYDVEYGTASDLAGGSIETGATSPISLTSLTPGTTYYYRVRATNAQGDGTWSAIQSFETAAAGAPHLGVVPQRGGGGFWLFLTPPFGVGSVTTYTIRRTVTGPGAPAPLTWTTADGTGTGITDNLVLEPGQTVSYQALATVAGVDTGYSGSVVLPYEAITYSAPYRSAWLGLSTFLAPLDDLSAEWSGAANASTSLLYGRAPRGWRKFSEGAGSSGATGVVYRMRKSQGLASAGTGEWDVLALFTSEQSAAGVRIGTEVTALADMIEVFGTISYYAEIKAKVDVETILACEIEWFSSGGLLLSRTRGDTVVAPAGTVVVLQAEGVAPADAVYAAVTTVDVDGDEWQTGSMRFVGEAMIAASVRLPNFNGNTPASADYAYEWMEDANASPTIRVSLASEGGSAVQDPDDDPMPTPPRPPQIEDSAVLDEIVWRRQVAAIPASAVREWIASVPRLYLHADAAAEREVRIRYWRNPDAVEPDGWVPDDTMLVAEQIISYMPPQSLYLIDGVRERGLIIMDDDPESTELDGDHFLYGEGGGPATWPELACGEGYILTLDVPVDSVEGNLTVSIDLTDRTF